MVMIPADLFQDIGHEKSTLDMDLQKLLDLKLAPDVKVKLVQQAIGKHVRIFEEQEKNKPESVSKEREKLINLLLKHVHRLQEETKPTIQPQPQPAIKTDSQEVSMDENVDMDFDELFAETDNKLNMNSMKEEITADKSKPRKRPASVSVSDAEKDLLPTIPNFPKRKRHSSPSDKKRKNTDSLSNTKRRKTADKREVVISRITSSVVSKPLTLKRKSYDDNGVREPDLKYMKLDVSKRPSTQKTSQPPKKFKTESGLAKIFPKWQTFKI